jgi:hypothetical protein
MFMLAGTPFTAATRAFHNPPLVATPTAWTATDRG